MRSPTGRHGNNPLADADDVQICGPDGDKVEIVQEWPPRINEIEQRFGELPDTVIFAWGNKIMVPSGNRLDQWLIDHELVHLRQQKDIGGVDVWWDKYLVDDEFRLDQELDAHIVEYKSFCRYVRDRNDQAKYLNWIGGRLANKMYGNIISRGEAMRRIRRGK